MEEYDVLVIGGGVNGCGVARDAFGRGLTVALVEQGDLAGATQCPQFFGIGLKGLEPPGRRAELIQSRCPKWPIVTNIQVLPLPSEV